MDLNFIKRYRWSSAIPYSAGEIITYKVSVNSNGQDLDHCWEEHPKFPALPIFTSLAVINIMEKVTARILDVVDRRSGVAVIVDFPTKDGKTGKEICYNEWTSFLMKMPGDGASKPFTNMQGAHSSQNANQAQSLLTRQSLNKRAGFPGSILSGTCTIGFGVRHTINAFVGGDSVRFQNVRLRLGKPVFPGDVVATKMWMVEETRVVY
ncbi:hypothetical protein BDW68DRAFT_197425 [Aspergillus falconensis]